MHRRKRQNKQLAANGGLRRNRTSRALGGATRTASSWLRNRGFCTNSSLLCESSHCGLTPIRPRIRGVARIVRTGGPARQGNFPGLHQALALKARASMDSGDSRNRPEAAMYELRTTGGRCNGVAAGRTKLRLLEGCVPRCPPQAARQDVFAWNRRAADPGSACSPASPFGRAGVSRALKAARSGRRAGQPAEVLAGAAWAGARPPRPLP